MQSKSLSSSPNRMAFLKISSLFFPPQMKVKYSRKETESDPHAHSLPNVGAVRLRHTYLKRAAKPNP